MESCQFLALTWFIFLYTQVKSHQDTLEKEKECFSFTERAVHFYSDLCKNIFKWNSATFLVPCVQILWGHYSILWSYVPSCFLLIYVSLKWEQEWVLSGSLPILVAFWEWLKILSSSSQRHETDGFIGDLYVCVCVCKGPWRGKSKKVCYLHLLGPLVLFIGGHWAGWHRS